MGSQATKWGDREGRRRDILAAAASELERSGYAKLNIRDVARGAGVSPGTVYFYFRDKDELFEVLYTERLERFHAEITPVCEEATSLEQLYVEIAGRYVEMYRVYGREFDAWASAQRAGDTRLQGLADIVARITVTIGVAGERLGATLPDLALPFLWTTLNGLAEHFTGPRHLAYPYTWDEMAAFAARTLVAGMR